MNGPVLLNDNARMHVVKPTLLRLSEFSYKLLPFSVYSSALLPTVYHLTEHIGDSLRNKRFKNREDAKNAFNDIVASKEKDFY